MLVEVDHRSHIFHLNLDFLKISLLTFLFLESQFIKWKFLKFLKQLVEQRVPFLIKISCPLVPQGSIQTSIYVCFFEKSWRQ